MISNTMCDFCSGYCFTSNKQKWIGIRFWLYVRVDWNASGLIQQSSFVIHVKATVLVAYTLFKTMSLCQNTLGSWFFHSFALFLDGKLFLCKSHENQIYYFDWCCSAVAPWNCKTTKSNEKNSSTHQRLFNIRFWFSFFINVMICWRFAFLFVDFSLSMCVPRSTLGSSCDCLAVVLQSLNTQITKHFSDIFHTSKMKSIFPFSSIQRDGFVTEKISIELVSNRCRISRIHLNFVFSPFFATHLLIARNFDFNSVHLLYTVWKIPLIHPLSFSPRRFQ